MPICSRSNFALVALILVLSLFAFTYALRKMAYIFALLGGLDVDACADARGQ